jgi:hypothetical protein
MHVLTPIAHSSTHPPSHRYSTSATPYPGQLHSTGTEDEFLSSYYFDLGPFESKTAGLLYKSVPSYSADPVAIAMWRTYQVPLYRHCCYLRARSCRRCRRTSP